MSLEVKIPAVGESITSGLIAQWHVADGAPVNAGDLLLTLETDKISTEITAEKSGTLTIISQEGEEVPIGAVVATIEEGEGRAEEEPAPQAEEETPAPKKKAAKKPKKKETKKAEKEPAPAPEPKPELSVLPSKAPVALQDESNERFTRKKLSPLRRKIANHLVAAQQNAALLTTFNECDMGEVMGLRKQLQEDFVAKHGIKLGFMSFFVKACVAALKAVPGINSRIEGDSLVTNHFYDIGVAIGTDKGLFVPVLRDCDQKSFAQIERDIADYATKAREGKIQLEDLSGGVFTITNGGIYGSMLSTPIINPPQSGILGMHNIQQRPMAVDGEVVIRPMMYLALSYDHRVVDGKDAVTFLIKVKDSIEQPTRLMLGL
jgi:2-oxoglutarate dehydrogenase E2 component (dihydrolipoamide succinyltransferase)